MTHIAPARKTGACPESLSVIIPVAGYPNGRKTGLSPALVKIKQGMHLIEYQVEAVKSVWPQATVIVVVGHQAEKVIQIIGDSTLIVEKEQFEKSGTARSISMGLRVTKDQNILIIHGDLFFERACLDSLLKDVSSTILAKMPDGTIGVNHDKGLIRTLDYGLESKWGQIFLLRGRETDLLRRVVHNRRNDKLFTFEILNKIVEGNGKIYTVEQYNSVVREIGDTQAV